MKKRFLIFITFLLINFLVFAQERLVLTDVSFHSLTQAKTLEFLNDPEIRNGFLKNLDTTVHNYLKRQLSYSNNLIFKSYKPELDGSAGRQFSLRKKDLATFDISTVFLSFDISERPLGSEIPIYDLDTTYINELLKKKNVCVYHLKAKIVHTDKTVVLDKQLFVLLARPDNTNYIGVEHPLYNLSPSGFEKLLKTCLPILLDSSNESELIQVTAMPAYVQENYLQSEIRDSKRTTTIIKKNIVQFLNKNVLQSLRFQEPGFEQILLKGKKITPLSTALENAIRAEKDKDYIYLWEEGRDVYANKNFKLITIATAAQDPNYGGSTTWVNRKTGIPLEFLQGNFHSLVQNMDTIAFFSIRTQVIDSSKKEIFNQLIKIKDSSIYQISKNNQESYHIYHYVLNGKLKDKTFKIMISGTSGSLSIKEIYYDNQLVCVDQGYIYPEVLYMIEPVISSETMNPLLWLSFSSLF